MRRGIRATRIVLPIALALLSASSGCGRQRATTPAALPDGVVTSQDGSVALSGFRWVVPSPALPSNVEPLAANNNLDLCLHDGRLYFAFRSAPTHFASARTVLFVLSSGDLGNTFDLERRIECKRDMREPRFLSFGGRLFFHWFEAGTNPAAFEPHRMLRMERLRSGAWTDPVSFGRPGEITWEFKVHGDRAYKTSYYGPVYSVGKGRIALRFQSSSDGWNWEPSGAESVVATGGASECGFEFDSKGNLVALTRNEQGDDSGFGSMLALAPPNDLWNWNFPAGCDPRRFDSPRVFRHADALFLLARRDPGDGSDRAPTWLPFVLRKAVNQIGYSLREKRTALYRIDSAARSVVHVFDLPSAGDTAFPALAQIGPDTYLIANYTSPLNSPHRSWIRGQTSCEGTAIYFATLRFTNSPARRPGNQ